MPLVNVMVNGRAYTIACDDGEEDHLRELAGIVDAKAREVLGSVGQVGDTRLLLMAALLIADEHHGAASQLTASAKAAEALSDVRGALENRALEAESAAADALEQAAKKVEDIAARLSAA
jgi:cell division protein ZapA